MDPADAPRRVRRPARATVREEPPSALAGYGAVPIAFTVREVLDVVPAEGGLGGLTLVPRRLARPYVKDYDAIPGEAPARWAERWAERCDVSRWGVLAADVDGARVGGAVVALGTPGVDAPEGRRDLAVLRDLRVAPAHRGRGIGRVLFAAAAAWARARLPPPDRRDAERQRPRLPLLRPPGVHAGRDRPVRLPGAARGGAAALVARAADVNAAARGRRATGSAARSPRFSAVLAPGLLSDCPTHHRETDR